MEKHYGFIESLDKFQESHEHKFCMPAHSGRYISTEFKALLDKHGIRGIESSMKALAKANGYEFQDGVLGDLGPLYHESFNSQLTLLLQNGSTLGNHIVTYCLAGKKVLIQSNSHISLHVGLQMAGARIYYVQPNYNKEYDIMLPVNTEQVIQTLEQYPEIQAVYLTNPTYDGLCFNVEEMKKACGDRLFIVDEAHGAHFYFTKDERFPISALNGGADASITSIHKTLGGLSATALINVAKGSKMEAQKVKMQHLMMSAMGDSVSPFILADLEGCIRAFQKDGDQLITQALAHAESIKSTISYLSGIKVVEFKQNDSDVKLLSDPLKIIIAVQGLTGPQIWDILETRYKINIEKTTKTTATITVHPHLNQGDVDALNSALKDISANCAAIKVHESIHNSSLGASGALIDEDSQEEDHQPLYKRVLNDRDLVLDIRDCFAGESELIPIGSALGRISCESKYACPPGFPVLLYGERIQESHIKLFSIIKEEGSVDLMVKVMKETHIVVPSSTD